MFAVMHMDGSGENNPPLERLRDLYDELQTSGIVDGSVAVINDDTGWCMSAHRDGRLVFEHLDKGGQRYMKPVARERVLKLWERLIVGDIAGLLREPWQPGYLGRDEIAQR
jgi:hypothetical protein